MNYVGEPRGRRRSSFQLLADAVSATDARVAPEDADARRRDAPDPTLTDDERAALEEAAESMRCELTKAKLIGPDLGSGGGTWGGGARAPDGRIYYAPVTARAVLCLDPATGETSHIGDFGGFAKYLQAVLGADGAIYFVPNGARRVLRLDPNTRETKLVGSDYGGGSAYRDALERALHMYGAERAACERAGSGESHGDRS